MNKPGPNPYQTKKVLRLSLPHLAAAQSTDATVKVASSITNIIHQTRSPFGEPRTLDKIQSAELEASLRDLEAQLVARDMTMHALETKLAERERQLWETEALLQAREAVLTAERTRPAAGASAGPSSAELKAYEKLKAQVDAQELALKEAKDQLREREKFLEDSEAQLMEKMAAQQEKETELEQREDDLRTRERQFRQQAGLPPVVVKKEPMEKA